MFKVFQDIRKAALIEVPFEATPLSTSTINAQCSQAIFKWKPPFKVVQGGETVFPFTVSF